MDAEVTAGAFESANGAITGAGGLSLSTANRQECSKTLLWKAYQPGQPHLPAINSPREGVPSFDRDGSTSAPTSPKTNEMPGMDHSNMPGMDHGNMPSMSGNLRSIIMQS